MKIQGFAIGSIGTNCYIISDDNGVTAIIDCDGDGSEVIDYVENNSLKPTHILLTHGHSDHIGAVKAVKEKYGCIVVAGTNEAPILSDPNMNLSSMLGETISIVPDKLVNDGDTIQVGDITYQVMDTPGHTAGSVCFITDKIIFSGDTLFLGSCGRTDFVTGSWDEIQKSLKRLASLSGDYTVYPGHGPATSLDYERKTNPFM